MSPSLTLIAKVLARPGMEVALLAAQQKLVAHALKEPGCVSYELFVSNETPGLTFFVEAWESHALWQKHMEALAALAFRDEAAHMIAALDLFQMAPAASR
jgi:quinol monooxygenase YgiN